MITEDQIRDILRTCNDPELGIDIVGLGLVYGIAINDQEVKLTMTLTTPGCPLLPYFQEEIESKIKNQAEATAVTIDITFDPPWDPGKMSEEARRQLTMLR